MASENAQKREFVAAAMARFVSQILAANPNVTLLVAGDMNTGETDLEKLGFYLDGDHDWHRAVQNQPVDC